MGHHTKEKGDLAVAAVIADAAKSGVKACVPISEHLPFDLVMVNDAYVVKRVQVRYATLKNNRIALKLRRCYGWNGRSRSVTLDRRTIDAFALYCRETDQAYYIRTDEIPSIATCEVWFRADGRGKRATRTYTGAQRLFAPVAQPDRAADF